MPPIRSRAIPIALVLSLLLTYAYAWRRRHYSDIEITSRAQLIVVAALDPFSIILAVHTNSVGGLESWDYLANIKIAEVLKGTIEYRII